MNRDSIQDDYCALLESYVKEGDETLLARATDLGHALVAIEAPAEEVAAIHGAAASRLAYSLPAEAFREAAKLMSVPLTGMLTAYITTLHKQTEDSEELIRQREHLAELVKEQSATLESIREELRSKERLAVLGKLVGVVGHELRNPLGIVSNSIFSVKERVGSQDESLDRVIARAERGIRRCDIIIEDLLSYAREKPPNLKATGLDGWLAGLLDEVTMPEGIQFIRKLSSGVELLIDCERLRRGVTNVIDNACQAMSENKSNKASVLTVETHVSDNRVSIQVSDTGLGISPDCLGKIFEPLYSTKMFGVGLGLPIVRQVMEQHAGGVEVESREFEGTLVTLWLPLGEQEA